MLQFIALLLAATATVATPTLPPVSAAQAVPSRRSTPAQPASCKGKTFASAEEARLLLLAWGRLRLLERPQDVLRRSN